MGGRGRGAEAVQCMWDGLPCTLSTCRWWIIPGVPCQRERVGLSHDSALFLDGRLLQQVGVLGGGGAGVEVSCRHHSPTSALLCLTSYQATGALSNLLHSVVGVMTIYAPLDLCVSKVFSRVSWDLRSAWLWLNKCSGITHLSWFSGMKTCVPSDIY